LFFADYKPEWSEQDDEKEQKSSAASLENSLKGKHHLYDDGLSSWAVNRKYLYNESFSFFVTVS
jgi:hypothetical protein